VGPPVEPAKKTSSLDNMVGDRFYDPTAGENSPDAAIYVTCRWKRIVGLSASFEQDVSSVSMGDC